VNAAEAVSTFSEIDVAEAGTLAAMTAGPGDREYLLTMDSEKHPSPQPRRLNQSSRPQQRDRHIGRRGQPLRHDTPGQWSSLPTPCTGTPVPATSRPQPSGVLAYGQAMIRCTFSPQLSDTAGWTEELAELPADGATIGHDGVDYLVLGEPTFDESAAETLAANLKVTPKPQ
jgi:hypothetical protein